MVSNELESSKAAEASARLIVLAAAGSRMLPVLLLLLVVLLADVVRVVDESVRCVACSHCNVERVHLRPRPIDRISDVKAGFLRVSTVAKEPCVR
jgi:hypothetical protein